MSTARHAINQAFGLEESTKKAFKENDTATTHRTKFWDLTIRQSVMQRPFIIHWLLMLINSTTMNLVTGLYKGYGLNKVVNDDRFLTLVGSIALFLTGPTKVTMGFVSDKLSNRVSDSDCQTMILPSLTFSAAKSGEWTNIVIVIQASTFSKRDGSSVDYFLYTKKPLIDRRYRRTIEKYSTTL